MSDSQHTRASDVFLAARRLPKSERDQFVISACGDDAALRDEVDSLLKFDRPTPAFLRADRITPPAVHRLAAEAARELGSPEPSAGLPRNDRPVRIGDYDIIETLGEGGMGIVYLAEQTNPRRRVALKVIRPAWTSPRAIRRFEHEAEALARLSHPGIAQLYEARLCGSGQTAPHIAMEYVSGSPLPVYARNKNATPSQRLELVARICDAVEHAHQRGVIHRDLKPGNILVNESGEPKVLDFGIARLCDDDSGATLLQTQTGELLGTLPYMSPEQIEGKSEALDTRADVYALGLVLYESLADRPAFDLGSRPLSDATRMVREMDPPALGSIDRRWRGDIETIVSKAIEKDRSRRYQSVGEMSADIRRFLADRPILARPASRIYQFRKFARRHRAMVAGVSLALVALCLGTAVATWQAVRAKREALRAEATSSFLRGMFATIDPYRVGPQVPVADFVRRTAANIETSTRGQPLLEAQWRNELGTIYYNLGLLAEADEQFATAHRIRREQLGDHDALTFESLNSLGLLRIKQIRYADAERLFNEALAGRKQTLGEAHPDTLRTMHNLAMAIHPQGRFDEAAKWGEAALDGQSRILGPSHPDTLATRVDLASAYRALGRTDEAARAFDRAITAFRATLGDRHPSTLFAIANKAQLLKDGKRYAEAEPLQREAVEGMREALAPDHPDTLIATANLAQILWRGGKPAQAEPIYRELLDTMRRVLGDEHAHLATVTTQYALVLEKLGRIDEAGALFASMHERYQSLYGADHPKTRQIAEHIARTSRAADSD